MNFKCFSSICFGAIIASLLPLYSSSADPTPASPFYLHNGDRVVMYGDSITDQKLYTVDTETYVTTRFPKLKIDWTAAGWGGDRVTGGGGGLIDERLNRDVLPFKPTVMTIMLGMNDAGYKAFDQGLYDTYTAGMKHILDVVEKGDPGVRFTLIEPSPYDDVTQTPNFPDGYNSVLIKYGQFLTTLSVPGTAPADFNTAMTAMLAKANASNPTLAQKIIPGRVHPSPAGHLVMAETLLKTWNAPATVTSVAIAVNGNAASVSASNATVSNANAANGLGWDELDNALPMPYDQADNVTALALSSSDFIQAIDREPLIVTGLAAGKYDLKIDTTDVGSFTSDQLAAGINLATLPTPMFAQAQNVQQLVVDRQNWHASIYHDFESRYWSSTDPSIKKGEDQFVQVLLKAEQKKVNLERAAAIPVKHHYTLTAVQ